MKLLSRDLAFRLGKSGPVGVGLPKPASQELSDSHRPAGVQQPWTFLFLHAIQKIIDLRILPDSISRVMETLASCKKSCASPAISDGPGCKAHDTQHHTLVAHLSTERYF